MSAPTLTAFEQWIDHQVVDNDGHRIGIIADVYVDDASGYPEWLAVMTGLFGSRLSFVPVAGAVEAGGKICIAFSKAFVKDSPNIDTEGTLTVEEEERLYRHYGMRYTTPEAPLEAAAGALVSDEHGMQDKNASPKRRLRKRLEKSHAIDLRDNPPHS